MRTLPFGFAALLGASLLGAQTVSPPVAEYSRAARGSFTLENISLFPLRVLIEPRGFTVSDSGAFTESELDTIRVHVTLSATSVRIPPRGSVTISYEASADRYPSWFVINSTLVGARTAAGLAVRVELPHVVYMNQRDALREKDVTVHGTVVDSASGQAYVTLENISDRLGRIHSLELSGYGHTASGGAFPLFPHQKRVIAVPWGNGRPPEALIVRLRDGEFRVLATAIP